MITKLFVAAALSCLSLSSHATPTTSCSLSDLTNVSVTKCAGFFGGNLIDKNPTDIAIVTSILKTTFGVSGVTGVWVEKLDSLSGINTINFTTPLSGDTIVALHFGGGSGGPGNGTAFYEFDAGSNLDSFKTIFSASSSAAIYMTTPVLVSTSVPEPTSYALFLMGLTGLGLMMGTFRRRRNKAQHFIKFSARLECGALPTVTHPRKW